MENGQVLTVEEQNKYLKELQEGYLNKEMSLWDLDSIRNEDYFGLSECESKKVHTFSFLKKGIMFYVSFTITKLVVNTKDFFEYDEIEIDLDKLSDDEEITIEKLERITGKEIEKINWDESRCIITEIGLN